MHVAERVTLRGEDWLGIMRRSTTLIWLCLARQRERRQLEDMSDEQLKDLGLSWADVERERNRWPWDGPARDL